MQHHDPSDSQRRQTYRQRLLRMSDEELMSELHEAPARAARGGWRDYAMENGSEASPELLDAEAVVVEVGRRWLGHPPPPESRCDKCKASGPWENLDATVEADLVCRACSQAHGMVPCATCGALFIPDEPMGPAPTCPDDHEPSSPPEPGPYEATFTPQAWVNDYATDIEPEGETTWDCSAYLAQRSVHLLAYVDETISRQGAWRDESDILKNDPDAPTWVRNWSGPFSIVVTRRERTSDAGDQ